MTDAAAADLKVLKQILETFVNKWPTISSLEHPQQVFITTFPSHFEQLH